MKLPREFMENFIDDGELASIQMSNVWLDVEQKRLLATNGHLAARCSVNVDDFDLSGLIPVEAFTLARKELKAISKVMKESIPDPWLKVECGADAIFIENLLTHTTHLVPRPKAPADKPFPAIDKVMPSFSGKPTITLNREYLTIIAKSLTSDSSSISLWVESDEKVCGLAMSSGAAVVGLMPMRSGDDIGEVTKRGAALQVEVGA